MALRILGAGHALVVHSRSPEPVTALVSAGAEMASTPAEVAKRSDVVVLMVASTADVETVIDGPDGLLEAAHSGIIVVDMGSHGPDAIRGLAERCEAAGAAFLDAPVSGGELGAQEGSLVSMVGGTL
jgi:3-hydroxyisobutyrate dehydrogenase-like beta-hydroxyacid dehydrogenase